MASKEEGTRSYWPSGRKGPVPPLVTTGPALHVTSHQSRGTLRGTRGIKVMITTEAGVGCTTQKETKRGFANESHSPRSDDGFSEYVCVRAIARATKRHFAFQRINA